MGYGVGGLIWCEGWSKRSDLGYGWMGRLNLGWGWMGLVSWWFSGRGVGWWLMVVNGGYIWRGDVYILV